MLNRIIEMKKLYLRRNAILALVLCSVVCVQAGPPPSVAELHDWGTAQECVDAGKHAGIDYTKSVDRAVAGNAAALAALFRFTESGWSDGAAGEGNAQILFGLLQRLGDRRFANVLRAQKKPVRKAVYNEVSVFPGFNSKKFPLTNAVARNKKDEG